MDFEKNWISIMSDQDPINVNIAEGVLRQVGIVSHVVNNTNSAIPSIGVAELYVRKEDEEEARKALEEAELI